MSRLITFGSSVTKGFDLPDQWAKHDYSNIRPSIYAWPNVLNNLLKTDTLLNLAENGENNLSILYKVLNFNWQEKDICIIGWGYFYRSETLKLRYNVLPLFTNTDPNNIDVDDNAIKNYLYIQHTHLYLRSINVQSFGLKTLDDFDRNKCPDYINIPELLDYSGIENCYVDLANDKHHPGVESHELYAKKIYERIKDYVIH